MGYPLDISTGNNAFLRQGTGTTITLPTAVKAGDLVVLWLVTSGGPSVAITGPTGYTLLGVQKDGTSSFGGRAAIYTRTYQAGDTTSPTFGGGGGTSGWQVVIVRSYSGTPSVVTDSAIEDTAASVNHNVKAFVPTTPAADLRLLFYASSASNDTLTAPTPTANGNNVFGVKILGPMFQNVGTPTQGVFYGMWEDSAGAGSCDTHDTVWAGTSSKHFERSVTINDGTTYNGGAAKEEGILFASPAVALQAYGGGAHVM